MKRRLDILLIDDDPGDVEITQKLLTTDDLHINIRVAENGSDALRWLENKEVDNYRPDLILLDLYMPGMNGREILVKIKEKSQLRSIPIIIISASESEDDIQFTYRNGASCYISKPHGLAKYSSVIESLKSFWMDCVKLPSKQYYI